MFKLYNLAGKFKLPKCFVGYQVKIVSDSCLKSVDMKIFSLGIDFPGIGTNHSFN